MAILILKQLSGQPCEGNQHALKRAALLVWGSLFVMFTLNYEAMGLGFGASQKREWADAPHAAFLAPLLAGFRTFEGGYVDLVNDGLSLISRHRRPQDTIMSLDFSNPFSYALAMPPAPGGATTLHYRGNFTDEHHPSPERLFGQASLVIVPKIPSDKGLVLSIPRIYGPYLETHFQLIGESQQWKLYRRNAEPAAHQGISGRVPPA